MASGDSADAEVIDIDNGIGQRLSYITVRFAGDDSGRAWTKKFTCDPGAGDRVSIGRTIRIEQLPGFGWQIDPKEDLAHGITPDYGNLTKG
jgi:hypothetical protein